MSFGKLHAAAGRLAELRRRYQRDLAIAYDFPTVQRFWRNIRADRSHNVASAAARIR